MLAVHTSIPNSTTDFLSDCSSMHLTTSGIIIEKKVLANTVALDTSISVTVLPSAVCVGGVRQCVCGRGYDSVY